VQTRTPITDFLELRNASCMAELKIRTPLRAGSLMSLHSRRQAVPCRDVN